MGITWDGQPVDPNTASPGLYMGVDTGNVYLVTTDHIVSMDQEETAESEFTADLARCISEAPGRKPRTRKGQNRLRIQAMRILRNAYATVVTEDVLAGREPWHMTLSKYAHVTNLLDDIDNA